MVANGAPYGAALVDGHGGEPGAYRLGGHLLSALVRWGGSLWPETDSALRQRWLAGTAKRGEDGDGAGWYRPRPAVCP